MTNQGPKYIAVKVGAADVSVFVCSRQPDGSYTRFATVDSLPVAIELADALNDREDLRNVHADD